MDQTLARAVLTLSHSFTDYTAARMKKLGLHYGALFLVLYLGRHPGCTQAELTAALGLDWGHSQRSVLSLAEDGFLHREKIGRSYHLSLTPKGEQAFDVLHQVLADWDREAMMAFTQPEQELLLTLMAKVSKQVKRKEISR